ncbi:MAG: GNAT family N-acetyltransferase [Burkholderiales bacterium]
MNPPATRSSVPQQPTPLTASHLTDTFDCGHPSLNSWLQKRAFGNAASGASRTYVVCTDDQKVIGYYALAAGSIAAGAAPGALRRNMPDPLPVIVLGRLAVDNAHAGQGIGQGLLKDAVLRSLQAAQLIGARALLCHAVDEQAKAFYLKHGFVESPSEPLTVLLGLRTAP